MTRFKSPFWEALGIFWGMIIGSGMFALPYAVSVSGLLASLITAFLAVFAVLSVHLAYGEIVMRTPGRHRLPGYVRLYLGKFAGDVNKISEVIFFNVTLLIYGVLGGIFLFTIFGGNAFYWTLIFFGVSSLILFFEGIEKIGFLNFILTIPLVATILIISLLALEKGGAASINFYGRDPFFAFGIFVFALTGLSVIPDAMDVFKNGEEKKSLKKVITLGTLMPLILYVIFVFAILTSVNGLVSEDSISSLEGILGRSAVILGAAVGFIAVFTSFLVLAYDLRQIYRLDLRMPLFYSGILSVAVPIGLFLLGLTDFLKMVSIVGGAFIALDGFFVIFILRKIRKTEPSNIKFLSFGWLHQLLLFLTFLGSILYEIVYQIL